jgi:hypothetical protein
MVPLLAASILQPDGKGYRGKLLCPVEKTFVKKLQSERYISERKEQNCDKYIKNQGVI